MDTSPASLSALVLLSARVGGLVLIAPVFSGKQTPTMFKAGLIVLLSLLLLPIARGSIVGEAMVAPSTFITEMVTGLGLGLGAALMLGAAEFAGDLIGMQIGLSGAAVLDPTNGSSQNVLGQFSSLFATTLFLAANGHIMMIDAIARSYHVVPLGAGLHTDGLFSMVRAGAILFALGLQFATPVIAVVLISHTALAVLSRAAPQLNVLSVAFPINIGLGLFTLSAAIPIAADFFNAWGTRYDGVVSAYLLPLAHGTAH